MTGLAQITSNAADLPLAGGCVAAFFLLVVIAVIWVFVIAPRRARRLSDEYAARGYGSVDVKEPELMAVLDTLTPIMPEGTLRFGEGPRQTLGAMISRSGSHPRYFVNVAESTDDQSDAGTVWRTLFLEPRPLKIETEFSARLSALNIGQGREERFGFQMVEISGASSEFVSAFSVFSKEGRAVTLSANLQRALLDAGRSLKPSSRFNTRFTPAGWAISVSNAYLQQKALRTFVDAAEQISLAL